METQQAVMDEAAAASHAAYRKVTFIESKDRAIY